MNENPYEAPNLCEPAAGWWLRWTRCAKAIRRIAEWPVPPKVLAVVAVLGYGTLTLLLLIAAALGL
jgi:hypothetical protein